MNQNTTKSGLIDRWLLCGLVWLLAGCSIGGPHDPNSGVAGMNVADAALDGGMPQTALNVTSSILELQPHNVIALVRQGDALAQLSQPDAAMESYRRALAVAPATAAALLGLGAWSYRAETLRMPSIILQHCSPLRQTTVWR